MAWRVMRRMNATANHYHAIKTHELMAIQGAIPPCSMCEAASVDSGCCGSACRSIRVEKATAVQKMRAPIRQSRSHSSADMRCAVK
jgi:hypothetical protein